MHTLSITSVFTRELMSRCCENWHLSVCYLFFDLKNKKRVESVQYKCEQAYDFEILAHVTTYVYLYLVVTLYKYTDKHPYDSKALFVSGTNSR